MIASLTGILKHKSPTEILMEVNGVGYAVTIPFSTYERLGNEEAPITLLTYLHVREDAMQLFGFATSEEREVFKLLISVTGIGPKIAQGILSGIAVADLNGYIARGNVGALTAIPGIGRKTAERLIVELKDKVTKSPMSEKDVPATATSPEIRNEALMALTSLGYPRQAAEKALRQVLNESANTTLTVEVLLKRALRFLS